MDGHGNRLYWCWGAICRFLGNFKGGIKSVAGLSCIIADENEESMTLNSFLKLAPAYRDYVWGGERLRPGHAPTAEAWVVWEDDVIESGPLAGMTLGEA